MQELELAAKRPRHRTVTTKSEEGASVAPNLLQQDFHADQPNQKWTSDTTYIWTQEGWVYLAVVLDLFSRMVVGWSMAAIVVCYIGRQRTRNGSGSPLSTSGVTPSRRLVAVPIRAKAISCSWPPNGMLVSMSRTAHCYDNAVTESFFHSLKGESLDHESFQTRAQARRTTFEFIESFYNRTRRHSTLQYMSPVEFENLMC